MSKYVLTGLLCRKSKIREQSRWGDPFRVPRCFEPGTSDRPLRETSVSAQRVAQSHSKLCLAHCLGRRWGRNRRLGPLDYLRFETQGSDILFKVGLLTF
jgi:hypothetical protein